MDPGSHWEQPDLSSVLSNLGLLMDDHLGHGHVWVLFLCLLDGLDKDLWETGTKIHQAKGGRADQGKVTEGDCPEAPASSTLLSAEAGGAEAMPWFL